MNQLKPTVNLRHMPDTEQWSRAVDPTSSRGGLVLAQLAAGLIVSRLEQPVNLSRETPPALSVGADRLFQLP